MATPPDSPMNRSAKESKTIEELRDWYSQAAAAMKVPLSPETPEERAISDRMLKQTQAPANHPSYL